MRVLLTGGTGFIGGHTYSKLLEKGHRVFLFEGDVREIDAWKGALSKKVDVVVHLAAVRTEKDMDFKVNSKGTENLFKAASKLKKKPKGIAVASSQAVYMGLKPPFREDMFVKPQTIYGKSKFMSEAISQNFGKKLGIRVVILRYSTVLGQGVRRGNNMSGPLYNWTETAFSGEDIKVFQDGKQTRDYTHVDDVVGANLLVVEKDLEGIFNVGGGKEVKLIDFANWVADATRAKPEVLVVGGKTSSSGPRHLFSDTQKLRRYDWKPKKTAKEAVYKFVKNFKK